MENLKVKLITTEFSAEEILPEYKTGGSAGMDLKAAIGEPWVIKPGETRLVPTGFAIAIGRKDVVGLVYARSGLASKHGIALANGVGVIDSDYRGQLFCPLINLGKQDFLLNPLERMAQLVLAPVHIPQIEIVEDLDETERGSGGFGHTGR